MEISKMLLIELQEGDSNKGGVSYAGERLVDFLLETDHLHLIDEEGGFDEINSLLSECGIKPIDFSDMKKELVLYYVYPESIIVDDTASAKVFTKNELIAAAQELVNEECKESDETPWVVESVYEAIDYLEEKRDWLYIHTLRKELDLNSLETKSIQEKTFGVTLYYSTQKDSDATPIFTEKELINVANELLINSSEDDVESFTSVENAINYLEEVAEWNPIKEYSQYFKQSELEEVK